MKKRDVRLLLEPLAALFEKALRQSYFSGASAAIAVGMRRERTTVLQSYGHDRQGPFATKIGDRTFFDLASLTKPLATTLCVLNLLDNGQLLWKSRLGEFFSTGNDPEKEAITVEQLLSHSSGLAAYQPYYRDFPVRPDRAHGELLRKKILEEPLVYRGGSRSLYSDLGYLLLGWIVEKVTGLPLDQFFTKVVTGPLGLEQELFFRPVTEAARGDGKSLSFAATEHCPWRHKVLQGEVHDEHCWLLDGVAGHAGLFGTARGVLVLCTEILDCWQGEKTRLAVRGETMEQAMQRRPELGTWTCGFDAPSATGSSGGTKISENSRGHLGFTGTSFWLDPVHGIVMVLLTNRVHPTRQNQTIKAFRPLFHDTVMETIFGNEQG